MNLVANSIDAIGERGSISISTGADGERYAILIADTGRGIPAELRDRIYEPFFTTKPVGQGTLATIRLPLAEVAAVEARPPSGVTCPALARRRAPAGARAAT